MTENIIKKIVSAIFVASLIGTVVTNAGGGPAFNILPGDLELFTGRNITKGQTDTTDPVTADPGDTIEGVIYYHNGVEDSVATNTRIQVVLPTVEATTHVLSARITADNAEPVTETIVNGQIVGKPNFTINASRATTLEYVPNSVRWFPDNAGASVPLPNNQTGAELFAGGLNIGDVVACWAHSGFVMFKVRLKEQIQGTPKLNLVKYASISANVTPFGDMWSKSVTVKPNDTLAFRLTVTNPGTADVPSVIIKDALPNGLTFSANSAQLYVNDSTVPKQLVGDIATGIDLGILHPSSSADAVTKKLTVIFKAQVGATFSCGETKLTNSATATGAGLIAGDTAQVVVVVSGGTCNGTPKIEQHKKAYNETQNLDATKVLAHAGDVITYTLTTQNLGTAMQKAYVIEDGVRDILDYADVQSISDGGILVQVPTDTVRDNQTMIRFPAVDIVAGTSVVRTFVIKVKNPLPTDAKVGNAFDFTMFNQYGDKVVVLVEHPAVAFVSIDKLVRNVTKSEGTFGDTNTANPGDTLEYRIEVKNAGNKTVSAKLSDVLPNGTIYTADSLVMTVNGLVKTTTGDLFADGLVLPDLTQGIDIIVTFKVSSSDKLANNTNLLNKAVVMYGENKEDTASTVIIVAPKETPVPPAQTPPPVQAQLPSTGANPFAVVTLISGLAYTWITKRKVAGQFQRLSAFVEII